MVDLALLLRQVVVREEQACVLVVVALVAHHGLLPGDGDGHALARDLELARVLVGGDLLEALVEVQVGLGQLLEHRHHRLVLEDADVQRLVILVVVEVQLQVVLVRPAAALDFLDHDVVQFDFVTQVLHAVGRLGPQVPDV